MLLEEFLEAYGNGACISIKGYCEEELYDYLLDTDVYDDAIEDKAEYVPTCLAREKWWPKVKDMPVKRWNIIGGGMYRVELVIELE